jgi:hypothetical protein
MRENRADAENVVRSGGTTDLHKKSWNYTREVGALFMNNPSGDRRINPSYPKRVACSGGVARHVDG